jgi:aminoglycoside phosphotransferase family enzyme/predicted kinase
MPAGSRRSASTTGSVSSPGSQRNAVDAALDPQNRLFQALRDPACYPHPVAAPITVLETHISCVFLTGTFAYKVKKAVNLGFVDFTTLDKRRFCCEEEIRLNVRFAPQLYLDVVRISGSIDAPRVGGEDEPIEYAVRMRQFSQNALADRMLARGALMPRHIDILAKRVAAFHQQAAAADEGAGHAALEATDRYVFQNFAQLRDFPAQVGQTKDLERIEQWTRDERERLREPLLRRARTQKVRECHGDLHLGNVVLLDDLPTPFDGIEFNPELRWIDVLNEVAFTVMDLHSAGRPDLATRFLNAYLEASGDYEGLRVLRYYLVYRAVVRAKIGFMRCAQLAPASEAAEELISRSRRYLALARSFTRRPPGFIIVTHGFSGSGKTTLTQPLLEFSGAVRIRSDVERKRMKGLDPYQPAASGTGQGIYGTDASEAVYRRLGDLARSIVEAGHRVIVDATFLRYADRRAFADLAARLGVAFAIIDFQVDTSLLRSRIAERARRGGDASDADLAVLDHQLRIGDPLRDNERLHAFAFDASRPVERAADAQTWAPLWQLLALATPA